MVALLVKEKVKLQTIQNPRELGYWEASHQLCMSPKIPETIKYTATK